MKFRVFCLAWLIVTGSFAQEIDVARLREVAEAQAAGTGFMGAVLVAVDGEVIFDQGYGSANLEWKTPNTGDTKFRVGSVTKQFTAATVLLLESRGLLKVEDPVAKYVPDTPAAWQSITLFDLLTHTSGIPNVTSQPGYAKWKLEPSTAAETVAHIRDLPLEFAPGEEFRYSNSNFVLLGSIIERVSGQDYATFLNENVLRPLGMNDSGIDSNSAILPQRASGYVHNAGGYARAPFIDMHIPHGAGALYSTTHDLLRWVTGLFGGRLLDEAALEKMTTPFKGNYAFGLVVRTVDGHKVIEHGGGIEGFNAHVAYYPEDKLTVIVLANVNGPVAGLAGRLAAVALGSKVTLPSERAEVELPAETLRSYAGVYRLAPNVTNTVRFADSGLTVQLSGQPAFPIFAESETKFFLEVVDAQVEFFKDASGHVTHLVQYQGGRTIEAPRIGDVVERKAIELPLAAKQACVGTYELQPGFDLVITLEGEQLMAQATGQSANPIFPESETRFYFTVVDAQLEFEKDANGVVTRVTLHQNGRDMPAPRK